MSSHRSKREVAPSPQAIPSPSCPSNRLPVPPPMVQGVAGSSSASGAWRDAASAFPHSTDLSSDMQEWGMNPRPPNGFVSYFDNHPIPTQHVEGSQTVPINVDIGGNDEDVERTSKRLSWTQEEDLRLVSAWLNNSVDSIHGNYKKNDQYWGDVAAAYNNTTPKRRARHVKQIKSHFEKIKKKVGWFCCSWKEVNSIYVSGQNEVQLIDKALKMYEDDYKDGQFMFMYCWKVLRDQPKWHAYLEDLDKSKKKRKFDDVGDMGEQLPSTDNAEDLERPIGTKAAKAQRKGKGKDKVKDCILELEDELHMFLDTQNTAKEDRNKLLEAQKRVSSEKVEAKRLAHLAAVENKKAAMLETYRSLMMLDTSGMTDDMRSEHMLALKCMREELFAKTD